jgi:hypothetical protein
MKKNSLRSGLVRSLYLAAIATAMLALAVSTAHADLLFSDSFAYPTGPLGGDGPPPGSPPGQGPWLALNLNPQVTSPGLRFRGILSAGNAAALGDTNGDNGDAAGADLTPVGVGGSGTAWIGFLIAQGPISFNGYAVVTFNEGFGPTAPGFGVLFGQGVYGIDNDTGLPHSQAATTVVASTTTAWLVVKLDFTAGTETLYVNPSRGSEPDSGAEAVAHLRMSPEFQASGFSRIVLKEGFNIGAYIFDEVRVGTAFNDVKR